MIASSGLHTYLRNLFILPHNVEMLGPLKVEGHQFHENICYKNVWSIVLLAKATGTYGITVLSKYQLGTIRQPPTLGYMSRTRGLTDKNRGQRS